MREIICAECGKKAIDMSSTQTRKYCSEECATLAWRKSRGYVYTELKHHCTYNKEVRCRVHACSKCGWNPEVEQKRKAAYV